LARGANLVTSVEVSGSSNGSLGDLTRLLRAWSDGDEAAAEALWPLVYDDLKVIARSVRRRNRGMALRGPQTTTLLHEAALRLLGADVGAADRRHFFAIAAQAMRFVLVDEARRRLAKKRAAEENAIELTADAPGAVDSRPEEVLAVHQALAKLGRLHPRHVQMVELRYFAGMTVEEVAEVLDVSIPTVKRDWQAARRWLYAELHPRPVGT
jgi:RNA polymerase sigma factor (TIGR02999 family)